MNPVLKSTLVKTSIAIACITSTSSYSQTIDDEIIVTAKGNQTIDESLFTTHVFNETDIELAQVNDIPALLDRLSGVSVVDSGGRGSLTDVFIRGASNDQTIVLVDGIRVGSATAGEAALNSYPIEAIEKIEIIKGPFSGIYGSDAVAGVIQIFTKKGADGVNSIRTSYGSDNSQEYAASVSIGDEKNSLLVTAQHESVSGFSRTTPTNFSFDPDSDGFRESVVSINGKTTITDNITAGLSVLYSESDVEIDGSNQTGSNNTDLNIALNISTQLSDSLTWTNLLGFNESEQVGNESVVINDNINSVFSTERETFTSELNYSLNSDVNFVLGTDYYHEDIGDSLTTNSFSGITAEFEDTSRDNKGVYAQVTASDDYFSLVASIRYDDNSDYGDDTNTSIAVGYIGNDLFKLSASYGTAFKAPSFNDLFFPLEVGFFFEGNPNVLPEESESYEFNISGDYETFNWRISLFRTEFDNLITFFSDPTTSIGTVVNTNSAEIEGYEISLHTKLSEWLIGLNIDVISTENLSTGLRLPGRAEETLNLSLGRDFGKLDIDFNLKFEHDRFETGASESRLASFALFDIRANYQISNSIKLSAKVENLFDKDFTINDGFNTAGRQAEVSMSYNF